MKTLLLSLFFSATMSLHLYASDSTNFKTALNEIAISYVVEKGGRGFIPVKYTSDTTSMSLKFVMSFDSPSIMTLKLLFPKSTSTLGRAFLYNNEGVQECYCELRWNEGKVVSVKFKDKYNSYFHTISGERERRTIESKFSQETPLPTYVSYENNHLASIMHFSKESGKKPEKEYYYTYGEEGKNVSIKYVFYRKVKNFVMKTDITTMNFVIEDKMVSISKPETGDYCDYVYNDKGLLVKESLKRPRNNHEGYTEYDYDAQNRIIQIKTVNSFCDEDITREYIGDKIFRETRKHVDKRDASRSNYRIFINEDIPDAAVDTEKGWEYQKGLYIFTLEGELIEEVRGDVMGQAITRKKKDGVWGEWREYKVRY